MHIAILAESNMVVVDAKPFACDCSGLTAERISAVQWDGDHGWIEFAGHFKLNEDITDFAPFRSYVDSAKPLGEGIANEAEAAKLLALCKTIPPKQAEPT